MTKIRQIGQNIDTKNGSRGKRGGKREKRRRREHEEENEQAGSDALVDDSERHE